MSDTNSHRTEARTAEMKRRRAYLSALLSISLMTMGTLLAAPALATDDLDQDAYGFIRRVEGRVDLAGLEESDPVPAEVNHPLLTGDQLTTAAGRAEVVLPDGSVIRIDRSTRVVFDALAGSPDSIESLASTGTSLSLDEGEIQIRTPEAFYGGQDLAVRTGNAIIYLTASGSYRLQAAGSTFTEVLVREGYAEADTQEGSSIARAGEVLEISGYSRPFVDLAAAGGADSLELWAEDLDRAATRGSRGYVDRSLEYAAAPLDDAGEWVYVDQRRAWRPYVRADWRPFQHGRWVYTPSGLTWVASAPWGWVTSHYGYWDLVPGYGWLWHPGMAYRPAGVYWYWGPTHVAWVPAGYYNRHYGGFGFGVHGWAGGSWNVFANWTFCPTRYFGRRGYDRYWHSGRTLGRERRFAVPRGIVTTDTRGLSPDRWGKPNDLLRTLATRVDGRRLEDVTDFVERRATRTQVQQRFARKGESTRSRLAPLPEEHERVRRTMTTLRGNTRVAAPTRDTERPGTRSTPGTLSRRPDTRSGDRAGNIVRDRSSREGLVRGNRSSDRQGERPVARPGARPSDRPGVGPGDRRTTASRTERPAAPTRGVSGVTRSTKPSERPTDRTPLYRSPRPQTRSGSGTDVTRRGVAPTTRDESPARKVLDRIRAHRGETRQPAKPTPQTRSGTVRKSTPPSSGRTEASRGNSSSSSSARRGSASSSSARRSTPPKSSTRSSGSSRSSARKSTPPRSSSNKSSARSRPRPRP